MVLATNFSGLFLNLENRKPMFLTNQIEDVLIQAVAAEVVGFPAVHSWAVNCRDHWTVNYY